MLGIKRFDHVGIRVKEKERAKKFYGYFGFKVTFEGVFEEGHPIIIEHPSGVVLNLLGVSADEDDKNILMDSRHHSGYTHMALEVDSIERTKEFLKSLDIELTGEMSFKGFHAIFIRDPDNNVIEFNRHDDGKFHEQDEELKNHP